MDALASWFRVRKRSPRLKPTSAQPRAIKHVNCAALSLTTPRGAPNASRKIERQPRKDILIASNLDHRNVHLAPRPVWPRLSTGVTPRVLMVFLAHARFDFSATLPPRRIACARGAAADQTLTAPVSLLALGFPTTLPPPRRIACARGRDCRPDSHGAGIPLALGFPATLPPRRIACPTRARLST
jgi:hypothetical protein